jgi:DNA-binding response OmpR family regulator
MRPLRSATPNSSGATEDAQQAIEILSSEDHVDIVVTDVRMPGRGDGVDVAVHARSKFPQIPVIMTSGDTDAVEDRLAQLALIAVTLGKPYRLDELTTLVKSLIERR